MDWSSHLINVVGHKLASSCSMPIGFEVVAAANGSQPTFHSLIAT